VRVTDAVLEAAFEALAAGRTLSDFCREHRRPDRRSIVRAIENDPVMCERFQRARDLGFDVLAEEVLQLVDAPVPKDANDRTDIGIVQQRRLQADVRLRLLSKWCTARYGDKVQIAGDGAINIAVITGIVRAPAESAQTQLPPDDPVALMFE
jgi:hypothetical protein